MDTPTSVRGVVLLVWVLVLLGTVVTVLAVIFDDELARAWAGGAGLSPDDRRVAPSFTPVVIVLYVVVISLTLVLLSFVQGGHNWARHCLAALVAVIGVATVSGIEAGPPPAFVACAVLGLVIDVAVLVCLYHPATSSFVARAGRRPARHEV